MQTKNRKPLLINNTPCDGWYSPIAFLRRYPYFTERQSETSRASTCDGIRKAFCQISNYLKQEGYWNILNDPKRTFNSTET